MQFLDKTFTPLSSSMQDIGILELTWEARSNGTLIAKRAPYGVFIQKTADGRSWVWGIDDRKRGVSLRRGEQSIDAIDAQLESGKELAKILDADAYRAAVQREHDGLTIAEMAEVAGIIDRAILRHGDEKRAVELMAKLRRIPHD